ncbi:hypothetical protein IWZ01DRAFT_478450 [Phyllosticta capitalensis]
MIGCLCADGLETAQSWQLENTKISSTLTEWPRDGPRREFCCVRSNIYITLKNAASYLARNSLMGHRVVVVKAAFYINGNNVTGYVQQKGVKVHVVKPSPSADQSQATAGLLPLSSNPTVFGHLSSACSPYKTFPRSSKHPPPTPSARLLGSPQSSQRRALRRPSTHQAPTSSTSLSNPLPLDLHSCTSSCRSPWAPVVYLWEAIQTVIALGDTSSARPLSTLPSSFVEVGNRGNQSLSLAGTDPNLRIMPPNTDMTMSNAVAPFSKIMPPNTDVAMSNAAVPFSKEHVLANQLLSAAEEFVDSFDDKYLDIGIRSFEQALDIYVPDHKVLYKFANVKEHDWTASDSVQFSLDWAARFPVAGILNPDDLSLIKQQLVDRKLEFPSHMLISVVEETTRVLDLRRKAGEDLDGAVKTALDEVAFMAYGNYNNPPHPADGDLSCILPHFAHDFDKVLVEFAASLIGNHSMRKAFRKILVGSTFDFYDADALLALLTIPFIASIMQVRFLPMCVIEWHQLVLEAIKASPDLRDPDYETLRTNFVKHSLREAVRKFERYTRKVDSISGQLLLMPMLRVQGTDVSEVKKDVKEAFNSAVKQTLDLADPLLDLLQRVLRPEAAGRPKARPSHDA